MVNRRTARECVVKALYAHTMGGGNRDHVISTVIRPVLRGNGSITEFAERLFKASFDTAARADELIRAHTNNWEMMRMALVDRHILRMAICEFFHFHDIPPKVTINEAIDIAKRYSTARSGNFINGVLDAVVYDLHQKDQLNKSGRGLWGMDELVARLAAKEQAADNS